MQQSKTPFFVIVGLAIVVVIGMFLARSFLAESLDLPTEAQEITIRVVVAPSIKPWVDQAAQDFNQANPKTQVEIITADSLIPESQFTSDPQSAPPAAWLAEATFIVETDGSMQFNDIRPVASTSLAWPASPVTLAQPCCSNSSRSALRTLGSSSASSIRIAQSPRTSFSI